MERSLATIQKVEALEPIYVRETNAEADSIELAHILGWKLVVKKGEFHVGDLAVYFETDSVLPQAEWRSFLKSPRIKIMKLNKMMLSDQSPVVSQGLALPLEGVMPEDWWLNFDATEDLIGEDVTELLGITKYENAGEAFWKIQNVKGHFHPSIPKTDETRIQSHPQVLEQLWGKPYYIALKLDGTSTTIVHTDETHVYSRNMEVSNPSMYWEVAEAEGAIQAVQLAPNLALQGEIIGEGIQANKLNIKGRELYIFNIYDLSNAKYWNVEEVWNFCVHKGLKYAPVLRFNVLPGFDMTLEALEEFAKGNYPNTNNPREGIVVRPLKEEYSSHLGGRLSFKVINTDFLLKEK